MDRPEPGADNTMTAAGHPHLPFPLSPSLTWFELFYDLVFVASIIVFSNAVSHHPTWSTVGGVAGVFAIVWFVWLLTVLLVNIYHRDDPGQRALVLIQMFLVTLVAVAVGDDLPSHTGWGGPLAGALLAVTAVMYARPPSRNDVADATSRPLQLRVAGFCLIASVLFTSTGFMRGAAVVPIWVVGGLLTIVPCLMVLARHHPSGPAIDAHHLVERLGAFTILVCGESFVKVALTATDGTLDGIDVWVIAFEFILVFSVWWAYFDDVPRAGMPTKGPVRAAWAAAHLPLHLALVGVAVGASQFIVAGDPQDIELYKLLLIAVPLAGTYIALALIGWASPRPWTWWLAAVRAGTAITIVAVSMSWWSTDQGTADALFGLFAMLAVANAWAVNMALGQDRSIRVDTSSPTSD